MGNQRLKIIHLSGPTRYMSGPSWLGRVGEWVELTYILLKDSESLCKSSIKVTKSKSTCKLVRSKVTIVRPIFFGSYVYVQTSLFHCD